MSEGLRVDALSGGEVYRLLTGMVVPRPIALVTTVDGSGRVNAAPFSYFNLLGHAPPVVGLGVGDRGPGARKDTAENILSSGEFVVNMVDEALLPAMSLCAADFPPEESEVEAAGLEVAPSAQVRPPRLVASPWSLECRLVQEVVVGGSRVLLGEVIHLWGRPGVLDVSGRRADTLAAGLVGRMHGGGCYVRTGDVLEVPRVGYAAWSSGQKG